MTSPTNAVPPLPTSPEVEVTFRYLVAAKHPGGLYRPVGLYASSRRAQDEARRCRAFGDKAHVRVVEMPA